ncbi:nitroreductase family protein [Clostridium sp. JN-9]|uniref:nitroreductase family protein n=1 Tax=Clostridium sp. JN-9 TaxID=2507159 RepID=UPI000FFE262C|nr:nitroreductase family protein [Clostridium sp. JN-9]QAT39699.1 nitroreductase family protein [Clostridium sp. JN-9]
MNSIFNRRSIRKYKGKPIEKEKIEKLLRAAMQAPSAGNQQPWEFIVIQQKDNLKKLSKMSPYAKPIEGAAAVFVLMADEKKMKFPGIWQQDMAAAAENILLEAVELDLGAVWLGVASIKEREDYIKEMFNLNENLKPFCVIALGYPDGQENKFIDRFDEKRIHWDKTTVK